VIARILAPDGQAITLVKPQFEAGREAVGKGGVVRDPATHRAVLLRFIADARHAGFGVAGLIPSPLRGPAGNIEFLAHIRRNSAETGDAEARVASAMSEIQAKNGERFTAADTEDAENWNLNCSCHTR
jgi:23S rRNA (cytidine1920-2'-O)/16S rRNA (cytidine1409-2'-O)-methyltransferase